MRDMTFGQYYPTQSFIHKMDARIKLIISILYMIAIFFVVSYVGYMATLLFLLTVTTIAKIPFKALLKSIKAIMFILVLTSLINLFMYKEGNPVVDWNFIYITDKGIDFTIKMILRLSLLVMGTSLLTFTTTPTELTDAIESLLKPLTYIKIPVHDIALIMSIALRLIPGLIEETDKIMMAQKSRGANLDTGSFIQRVKAMLPILIPLFVGSFRRADELADALDARCYNASPKRTKLKELKLSWRDGVASALFLTYFILICLDKYLIGGSGMFVGVDRFIADWIGGML